ncbi:MAG: endonuclease [Euryarchaeota archaeon]|nr:endonuclease [Euryarchaeota archaeon]
MPKQNTNVYEAIIEKIFTDRYKAGQTEILFDRDDIPAAAQSLGLKIPANLGDVVSAYRFRKDMPQKIQSTRPKGKRWIIRLIGRGKYCFALVDDIDLSPNPNLMVTKIPDSTPEIVKRYAMSDEQALLAIVRYNRLIDIFTGITCYSLQNHLRTTASGIGQVETDELYVGVDGRGINYAIPVQAKGGNDRLSVVQIEQDLAVCRDKKHLSEAICVPVAAQFMSDGVVALFQFGEQAGKVVIIKECHYRLVAHDDISDEDLEQYKRLRTDDGKN